MIHIGSGSVDRFTGYCLILILVLQSAAYTQRVDSLTPHLGIRQAHAPMFFLDFYQQHLSELRGTNCPMYPSCSNYARIVIERYSPGAAFFLITDRLMRCGHDYASYNDTIIDHQHRIVDQPYRQNVPIVDDAPTRIFAFVSSPSTREADFLYSNGFHEQAYHEYLRALAANTNITLIKKAAYAVYYAYDYQRFIKEILSLTKLSPTPECRGELFMLTAKRSYSEGMFDQTFKILQKYRDLFTTPAQYEEYRLLHMITALYGDIDTVTPPSEHDFSPESPLRNYAVRIDSLHIALDNICPRSRAIAGFLSVILPGSGYVLGGRKRTALFSFLCNSLLTWSTVEFIQRKSYGTAGFCALIGSGFYLGSVVGSVRSVDEYNRRRRHALISAYCSDLVVDP